MSKKPQSPPPPAADSKRWSWIVTPWTVTLAVCGAIGALLLNINPILKNLRELPHEVRQTTVQFSSWYHQDAAWTGYWTSTPEAYVDEADMKLSPEKIVVDLKVQNGVIDGTIATPQLCKAFPIYDFLLVRGKVGLLRNEADIVVWDTFEGHDLNIAGLSLKREGAVMTVLAKEGNVKLFPGAARIAVDPNFKDGPSPKCEAKQKLLAEVAKQLLAEKRKEADQKAAQALQRHR